MLDILSIDIFSGKLIISDDWNNSFEILFVGRVLFRSVVDGMGIELHEGRRRKGKKKKKKEKRNSNSRTVPEFIWNIRSPGHTPPTWPSYFYIYITFILLGSRGRTLIHSCTSRAAPLNRRIHHCPLRDRQSSWRGQVRVRIHFGVKLSEGYISKYFRANPLSPIGR